MNQKQKEILFTEVLDHHKNQIFRICWGFAAQQSDAEDLLQEVLINIWRGIGKFEGKSSLNTWVYKVAVNTCLMFQRNAKRKIKLQFQDSETQYEIAETSIENSIINNERIHKLMEAIKTLNKTDKTIALLLLEEMSYGEIAKIIGTTENNIGVKVHRIKEKLKNKLS